MRVRDAQATTGYGERQLWGGDELTKRTPWQPTDLERLTMFRDSFLRLAERSYWPVG